MRIAILGYSGSGKSTLARKISTFYNIDVLHLDKVQFLENWEIRDASDKERLVKEFMDTHENWVIDGNYSKLYFQRRLDEADQIILLLFNRFNCLYRVWKRYRKYKNTTRPDMGEGCNEKLDLEFVKWVLRDGRTKTARERYKWICKKYKEKVVVIKNQKQLDAWGHEMEEK